jgi:serine/threonine-protein kinase
MTEPSHRRIAAGTLLSEQYRVEEWLGGGGYGDVYRAHAVRLGRPVAVKVMRHRSAEGVLARFLREAQIAKRLEHPNTVRLLDYGGVEEGMPFLVWELLRGETLAARLERSGPMDMIAVVRLATQVLSSLEEAHGAGIVHRDIKPSNLMLCDFAGERDFVKVLDFGVAKDVSITHDDLTGEGEVLGTPRYMAPEQVLGRAVVPATDLYALGLVMAEALTGKAVVEASSKTQAVGLQAMDADLAINPKVLSGPLGDVVRQATRKRMGARFGSAEVMRRAIRDRTSPAASSGASTQASERSSKGAELPETLSPLSVSGAMPSRETTGRVPGALPRQRTSRSGLLGVLGAGGAAMLVLTGGVFWMRTHDVKEAKPEAASPPTSAPLPRAALNADAEPNWHPGSRPLPEGVDMRAFDPDAFLLTALARAREVFPDASLTSLSATGVWQGRRVDLLGMHGGGATYWFRSPEASKPPASHPDNVRYEGRCTIVVSVDDRGLSAQIPLGRCDEPLVSTPRCATPDAVERFRSIAGTSRTKFGASVDYRVRMDGAVRWHVGAGTIGSEFVADDCR